mmetsp:Transcript_15230/g.27106  ORF Transcript_15230/g.27106 Transcript_15230/m.27106 type:complete len:237 (-) Transcript_15230:1282-1992(-)
MADPRSRQVLQYLRRLLPCVHERWNELSGNLLLLLVSLLRMHRNRRAGGCLGRNVHLQQHHPSAPADGPDAQRQAVHDWLSSSLHIALPLRSSHLCVLQALGQPRSLGVTHSHRLLSEGLLVALLPAPLQRARVPNWGCPAQLLQGGALRRRLRLGQAFECLVAATGGTRWLGEWQSQSSYSLCGSACCRGAGLQVWHVFWRFEAAGLTLRRRAPNEARGLEVRKRPRGAFRAKFS